LWPRTDTRKHSLIWWWGYHCIQGIFPAVFPLEVPAAFTVGPSKFSPGRRSYPANRWDPTLAAVCYPSAWSYHATQRKSIFTKDRKVHLRGPNSEEELRQGTFCKHDAAALHQELAEFQSGAENASSEPGTRPASRKATHGRSWHGDGWRCTSS
jgi:hypothetical protein